MADGKISFIPTNEVQRTLILRIQKAVADSPLMEEYKMYLTPETFNLYTMVLQFMEGVRRVLHKNEKQTVSIGDIVIITKSIRNKESAEKNGSINAIVELGKIGKQILDKGIEGFEDVLDDDPIMKGDMEFAGALAKKILAGYRCGINTMHQHDLYYMTIMFLIYAIEITKEYAENPHINENDFAILIGDYISFGFVRNDVGYEVVIDLEKDMKIFVKSDAVTERE